MGKSYNISTTNFFFEKRKLPKTFDILKKNIENSFQVNFVDFKFDYNNCWHNGWKNLEKLFDDKENYFTKYWATFVLKDISCFLWMHEKEKYLKLDKNSETELNNKINNWLKQWH